MAKRRFYLTIDSGSPDEPSPRAFGSFLTAYNAQRQLLPKWQRFAWITEDLPDGRSRTLMRDGQLVPVGKREDS